MKKERQFHIWGS